MELRRVSASSPYYPFIYSPRVKKSPRVSSSAHPSCFGYDLTAYPVILGVGVNAEFDLFVGGAGFGWCGCYASLCVSGSLAPLDDLVSSTISLGGVFQTVPVARIASTEKLKTPLIYESSQLGLDAQKIADMIAWLQEVPSPEKAASR
jgi:hypothetical protein